MITCPFCFGTGALIISPEKQYNPLTDKIKLKSCPHCNGSGWYLEIIDLDDFAGPSCQTEGEAQCYFLQTLNGETYCCNINNLPVGYKDSLVYGDPCEHYCPESEGNKTWRINHDELDK